MGESGGGEWNQREKLTARLDGVAAAAAAALVCGGWGGGGGGGE